MYKVVRSFKVFNFKCQLSKLKKKQYQAHQNCYLNWLATTKDLGHLVKPMYRNVGQLH